MVDRIEHNVVNAVEYVATAKMETKKAAEYQSSARRVRPLYWVSVEYSGEVMRKFSNKNNNNGKQDFRVCAELRCLKAIRRAFLRP